MWFGLPASLACPPSFGCPLVLYGSFADDHGPLQRQHPAGSSYPNPLRVNSTHNHAPPMLQSSTGQPSRLPKQVVHKLRIGLALRSRDSRVSYNAPIFGLASPGDRARPPPPPPRHEAGQAGPEGAQEAPRERQRRGGQARPHRVPAERAAVVGEAPRPVGALRERQPALGREQHGGRLPGGARTRVCDETMRRRTRTQSVKRPWLREARVVSRGIPVSRPHGVRPPANADRAPTVALRAYSFFGP